MSMETQILQIQHHEPILEAIKFKYVDSGLKFGWQSNRDKKYDYGHWTKNIFYPNEFHPIDFYNSPYIVYHPEVARLWEIIREKYDGSRALSTCYLNGYTYGTDAYIHIDNTGFYHKPEVKNICETAILYVNDSWDPDWAGETVILDENKEIEASVLPKPGRVMVFDGLKPHGARPVSRACPVLRMTMAFKAINPQVESEAANFLIKNVSDIRINNKSLFEILYDGCTFVSSLIRDRTIASAVLFRSIYGTEELQINKVFSRDTVKELIGEEAEQLVYEFSTIKARRQVLHSNSNNYDQITLENLMIMDYITVRELYAGYNQEDHDYILYMRDKVIKIANQRKQVVHG